MMKKTTQNITHKMSPRNLGWLRWVAMMVMMLASPMLKAQDLPFELSSVTDTTNGTEKLYWLEIIGFNPEAPGFYAIADVGNKYVSTSNMPNERMLWYFMDAGTANDRQYFYIVNKSTGKFLQRNGVNIGGDKSLELVNPNTNDRSKFSIGGSEDAWVFYLKEGENASYVPQYWINKKSGNLTYSDTWLKSSNYGGSPDGNSKWKIIPKDNVTWSHPFENSTVGNWHHYKIHNASSTAFYMSFDNENYVTVSNQDNNNRVWYFEEAASDPNIPNFKYYYIVNSKTGKYMYFRGTKFDGSALIEAVQIQEHSGGEEVEDRYQFAIVNSVASSYTNAYTIIPKKLMGVFNNKSNGLGTGTMNDGQRIGTKNDRGSGSNTAHWKIEEGGLTIAQPTHTFECDNSVSLSAAEGAIYYNLGDGTQADPTISNALLYDGNPFTPTAGQVVKAVAYLSGAYSSVLSFTYALTHTEAPSITYNATTITITGPEGSTIYYTVTAGNSGTDPIIDNPGTLSGPTPVNILFSGQTDVRAIAKVSTLEQSCVTRLVTLASPTVTITYGDCNETSPTGNLLTIIDTNVGGTLWYAVTAGDNSAAPDITAIPNPYTQYTGDVVLDDLDGSNTYYTVHAYAKSSDGSSVSAIESVSHQMKTGGKPELTPPVGSNPVVLISGGTFGDVAVCTATGVATQQIPVASDGSAEYTISPEATGTLNVKFEHGDWLPSCEANYTLPGAPETPTWSQDCANLLSLHCATPMADIHFTTDGTEPTLASYTYVAGCLDTLSVGRRIRAKAFLGFRASGELDYTYNPTHSATPQFFVDGTAVVISVPGHTGATIYFNYSTNGNNTMPSEPNEVTTTNYQYQSNTYTLTGVTIFSAIAVYDDLLPSCPVRVVTRPGYSINNADRLALLSQHPNDYFFIFDDIDASGYTTTVANFTGVIEGNNYTISNLTAPLFGTATDAVIHDLTLDNVQIDVTTADANVGAFACKADGNARIYNCGIFGENSSVSGTKYVGGLVGLLDGYARVINCFSYANINGGTHRAGIVGYNNYASTSSDLRTMVMNCMFYGDISTTNGTPTIYPVYGGMNIHNKQVVTNNSPDPDDTGLNNYCYFYYHGDYVNHIDNNNYHGSLGAEERFLNRFEFFRQTLNSTRNLAAYYISGDATKTELVAKWVLDKSIAPYPILKAPGYYPSIVNHDAEHAVPIDPDNEHYNEGRKLGTLTVNIQKGSGGAVFKNEASSITTSQLVLNITDKDFDHDDYSSGNYDFNYKKVQLPYYNQVGTGNYTNNRVVTGWKIVEINGSTTGTGSFTTGNYDYPNWNFVDRACSNKDLYSVSGRVFSQGAYWEVPDGVISITIEPYWAKAAYLSDAYYDRTYSNSINGTNATTNNYNVTVVGSRPTSFNGQTVYNLITGTGSAIAALNIQTDSTVYDYAVVLVGNYHQNASSSLYSSGENKPVTFMSADLDGDCEPDNTLFYYHNARQRVAPVRFDFLNMPGIGMVKRTWDSDIKPEPGIFKPAGWFEITNTVVARFGQFEYCDGVSNSQEKLFTAPLILQGGIYEQFVSSKNKDAPDYTQYLLIGGNAWFKNFANGCHTGAATKTHNMPINVTGGDYENFYLSGIYQPGCPSNNEHAECYMDGGRFGEVAGAGMQEIVGTVTWCINAADIENFFGGGINAAKPITDSVTTTISNSRVTEFYGGPKFGDMKPGKTVTTIATNCHFGLFFGAGYGGTAFNKWGYVDASAVNDAPDWAKHVQDYYERAYNNGKQGISTSYEYEFILHSDGKQTVTRFFVNYASLSLASTQNVNTNLSGCTMVRFYGGGRLGAVNGDVNSVLTDCTVEGDVFGSGYSAEVPTVMVMPTDPFVVPPRYNRRAGVFNDDVVEFPSSVQYTWSAAGSNANPFTDDGDIHLIHTEQNLNNLGAVLGNATLTINGNSVVKGDVYGGGALSSSNTNNPSNITRVNINGGSYGVNDGSTITGGNIYGGGMGNEQNAVTEGNVEVNIGSSSQSANNVVINGNVYGCNNANGSPQGNVTVNIYKTKHNSDNIVSGSEYAIYQVFGGGNQAHYTPTSSGKKTTVHVHNCDNTIEYVYGGGNAANVGVEDGITSGTEVIIDGGHMDWIFGGGNGAGNTNPGANIFGDAAVTFHAGKVGHLFGGSNEKGSISGTKTVSVLGDGLCDPKEIGELYGGNNKADATGDISLTMACTDNPCKIDYLFGGSRQANITGNVELNVYGGEYDYVFGGNNISGVIGGNVTLNLYGGTIHEAAFGGNKGGGSIDGDITVNVNDAEDPDCPLVVNDVFGAGDQAVYTAPTGEGARDFNPMVNINHIRSGETITGNVYGGGNGHPDSISQVPGSVTGNPKVIIGDLIEGHRAAISGNVYGGGNAAKVTGSTTVLMQKTNSTVAHDIYGGGNLAHVSGATTVNVTGGTVTGDVYGGGALANVGTNDSDSTIVTISGGTIRNVYGGGLGQTSPTFIAALVNGAVQVTVNGGTVTGSVYGCNNVNGAPQSTVKVDIYGTDTPASGYALGNVFGGGNAANYAGTPVVKVHNCDNSIGYVYGGGNAASVAATDVTIYGGDTIGNVFGGCYGADVTDSTNVKIYGGTIRKVFGGNNQSGTITGAIQVNVDKQTEEGYASCPMKIEEVYGGGNVAESAAGKITIGCTGDLVALGTGEHYGVNQEGIRYVYGGANQADITGNITLNINSGIVENVFGGNNTSGSISGTITVNIEKDNEADCAAHWYVGNVYGGGNLAAYSDTPAVNIKNGTVSGSVFGGGNEAGVGGGNVTMTGGTVMVGLYGGCNTSGLVDGNIVVNINNGTIGSSTNLESHITADVFGGGFGSSTTTSGDVEVNINGGDIYGDVYGGSALGSVNTENGSDTTIVNVLNGVLHSVAETVDGFPVYHGGNVYGGGLGNVTYAAAVNGEVIVNIGSGTPSPTNDGSDFVGEATIEGNIYGCNNTNGSPQQNVTVNIFKTAHTDGDGGTPNNTVEGDAYAIANVFGGGNKADFQVGGKTATVNVYGCYNTIYRTFGGGNAAATNEVFTMIQGGRIAEAFSGGNGEVSAANVGGNVNLTIHGGTIGETFGGSNQQGTISGQTLTTFDNEGPCDMMIIEDHYCGGKYANYVGDIEATIYCSEGMNVRNLYGGCKQAHVVHKGTQGQSGYKPGNVTLTVYGGTFENIYGGSEGTESKGADIEGNVTLNVYGGTVTNAIFGGSNIKGAIGGTITVNIEDFETTDQCPLDVSEADVYGGGNVAAYPGVPEADGPITAPISHPDNYNYPQVNIKNATVKNVFGGGLEAEVKGNPQIKIKKGSKIRGNVYGGGNMGEVIGDPKVIVNGKDDTPNPIE